MRSMSLSTRKHCILTAVFLLGVLLCSCNATKFVPEDQQLLYKVNINVDGTKEVPPTKLRQYLRQTHNTEILGFWKLQLHLYNTAPTDTLTKSRKRAAKNAHKIGEAPVIYDHAKTGQSMEHIRKAPDRNIPSATTPSTLSTLCSLRWRITRAGTSSAPVCATQPRHSMTNAIA